jgi:arylsulfatase A-like enzyme
MATCSALDSRIPGILWLACMLLASATSTVRAEGFTQQRPPGGPNILFVIMDDVGVDQMRSFGYRLDNQPITPAIDTLARAGVRFGNTWAMPECSPSRVSFFTGRYPLRTGVLNITIDNTLANSQMSPFEVTTPQILRDRGYKSGFFGKWHHTAFASNAPDGTPNPGNPMANAAPRDMGWDRFEGMLEGAPRGIDTTAGNVAPEGTYSCGFVTDAPFGACYLTDGSCSQIGDPGDTPSADPGRSCLESGGILVPAQSCQSPMPQAVSEGFQNFNGYYVAPLLINREDGSVELVAGFDERGNVKPPVDPRARRYLTQQQTDAAIAWIKSQRSQGTRWMATVSYAAAHLPTQQPPRALLPEQAVDSSLLDCTSLLGQRSLMNEMIEAMDHEIGRLLVETGLATRSPSGRLRYRPDATDTMVVLVGDNGSYLQTVRLPFDPTRAKGTVYQTGVWVPLIVSGPMVDGANVGRKIPHMVNAAVDLFALFGEIGGVDVRGVVPRSHRLDSRPMLPYLKNAGQRSLRKTNFTQTGTVLAAGEPSACVLPVAGEKVCLQIFTFAELCETEGGQWYGDGVSCCDVQAKDPDVTILPYAATAVRDDRYKLVREDNQNCATDEYDMAYSFYEINEATPLPKLDRADDNLLTAPTLPAQGLTKPQLQRFNRLLANMESILDSEPECPGDGNLDKKVNLVDIADWVRFAALCTGNPNQCSSVYDFNLDAVTNQEDLEIIKDNFDLRCRRSPRF